MSGLTQIRAIFLKPQCITTYGLPFYRRISQQVRAVHLGATTGQSACLIDIQLTDSASPKTSHFSNSLDYNKIAHDPHSA
ncbi:hypothetical protein, partial [Lentibacillus sp.]|uniref:hypothetical protein n=1 Tax=Lentibacillus sp. TaxID=1925746 RepID=UPI002B4B3004